VNAPFIELRYDQDMTQGVNRIVFVNPDGELETISPDGSGRRQLTSGDLIFQFPAWSPNSRYIAALGLSSSRAGVFLIEDAPGEASRAPQPIYASNRNIPIYAYWSPDGQHISFITNRPAENLLGLHVVSLNDALLDKPTGDSSDRPIAMGQPCFWDWSADGRRILLHTGPINEESAQLNFIDPFNPRHRRRSIPRPGLFQAPGIARSGQFWAFGQVDQAGRLQLVVDGYDAPNRLVIPYQGLAAMSWSPTNNQLAYISPTEPLQTYYGPLRLLDVSTAKVRMLADDVVIAFFWSPDGQRIAYFTVANVAEYLRERVFPSAVVAARAGGFLIDDPSAEDTDEDDDGQTLPLNLWSVDVESGESFLITTFRPARSFASLLLPFFDQYALSHRIWSPNSDAVVLPIAESDDARDIAGICIVPIERRSGPPRRIAEGTIAFWSQC
jgi:TolB protein